jgi:transcriptional regulator with XRE-family HTH domain
MGPMSVGGLIAQLRTERTLSQARLAELLADISGNPAITRHEVSRWERGQRQPRRYWLHWIAIVFDMSLEDLEDAARLAGPMEDEVAEAAELAHRVAATDVSARPPTQAHRPSYCCPKSVATWDTSGSCSTAAAHSASNDAWWSLAAGCRC